MSLFRNRNKKFETDLQKQMGKHEVKPSGRLWDKLNHELGEGSFEQNIQAKFDDFEGVPNNSTWQKIELQLPQERSSKPRLVYFFFTFLIFLFSAGVWMGYELKSPALTKADKAIEGEVYDKNLFNQQNTSAPSQTNKKEATRQNQLQQTAGIKNVQQIGNDAEIKINAKRQSTSILSKTKLPVPSAQKNNVPKDELKPLRSATADATLSAKPGQFITVHTNQQPDATQIILPAKQDHATTEKVEQANEEVANISADTVLMDDKKVNTPAAQLMPASADSISIMTSGNSSKQQEQLNIDEEKPGKFSMLIMVGTHLSFNHLQAPVTNRYNMEENMALRNSLEKPRVDWSGGFYLDYMLSEKWRVAMGIAMLNFTQQFNYNLIPALGLTNGAGEQGVPVFNPADSVVSGSLYNTRIRYSWTEIPLLFTYQITNGQKWNVELQAGASYAILNAVDASIISYDNTGLLQLKDKEAFPGLQNSVFIICNPAISYTLNKKVQIGLMPTFKYSLNTMIKNENWVQQHPYFIGMALSLRKRF